jgi:hypothetical protein
MTKMMNSAESVKLENSDMTLTMKTSLPLEEATEDLQDSILTTNLTTMRTAMSAEDTKGQEEIKDMVTLMTSINSTERWKESKKSLEDPSIRLKAMTRKAKSNPKRKQMRQSRRTRKNTRKATKRRSENSL